MPDHEMASSSPSQSISYHRGVQGCPGGCCGCQQGQYGNIRAETFPVPTYRLTPLGTASQRLSPSSNKLRDGIVMPDPGFNTRCMRYCHGSSNGLLDFSLVSNRMLPSTIPSVVYGDQQRKGNGDFTCMPLQIVRDSFPSMYNSEAHSAPDESLHCEIHGSLGLDDAGIWHQGFRMPINNASSLNHAVTWPMQHNLGSNQADHMHCLGQDMFNVPPWVNEPAMPPATSMQDPFWDTIADMSNPLYDLYSPFQIGVPWDESLQQDMEDIPLPSFPRNESFDHTLHNPNSLVTPDVETIPTDSDLKASSWPLEPTRTLELRTLMPKPPIIPSDAVSDTDSDEVTGEISSKLGRRRCLTEEEKKTTARLRKIGSCARCIAKKIKCTEGDVCEPCQMLSSQYTLQQAPVCPRGRLSQYNEAFFPRIVFEHLDEADMTKFLSNAEFTNMETRIHLSLGPSYPFIPLVVSAFRTADEKFSHVPDLTSNSNDGMQSFATVATSSLGVRPSGNDQLTQTCIDYVEMINSYKKTKIGCSRITRKVLDAARRFQQTSLFENQDVLLRKAIKIAELYMLMGKRFFFSKESPLDAVEDITELPYETSRFLNRQIKSALYHQLKKLIPEALCELDDRLRPSKKGPWAVSLLTHLLLSTCVEYIQVAVDAFVFSKIPSAGPDHNYIRQSGRETSRSLEQMTLEHSRLLLEGVLNGITKTRDPFKVGAQMNDEFGLNEAETNLVNDIRQIVIDHEEEIARRAEDMYYGGLSCLTSDHKAFRVRNSARLVSKVLRRLC